LRGEEQIQEKEKVSVERLRRRSVDEKVWKKQIIEEGKNYEEMVALVLPRGRCGDGIFDFESLMTDMDGHNRTAPESAKELLHD
jgi:hypothetical protein